MGSSADETPLPKVLRMAAIPGCYTIFPVYMVLFLVHVILNNSTTRVSAHRILESSTNWVPAYVMHYKKLLPIRHNGLSLPMGLSKTPLPENQCSGSFKLHYWSFGARCALKNLMRHKMQCFKNRFHWWISFMIFLLIEFLEFLCAVIPLAKVLRIPYIICSLPEFLRIQWHVQKI